ncbi:MAG: pilin, partial [Candidatus Jordarchaeaceae archaeon]
NAAWETCDEATSQFCNSQSGEPGSGCCIDSDTGEFVCRPCGKSCLDVCTEVGYTGYELLDHGKCKCTGKGSEEECKNYCGSQGCKKYTYNSKTQICEGCEDCAPRNEKECAIHCLSKNLNPDWNESTKTCNCVSSSIAYSEDECKSKCDKEGKDYSYNKDTLNCFCKGRQEGDNENNNSNDNTSGGGQVKSFSEYMKFLIDFIMAVVGILAMFMIVLGGYQYMASSGNAEAAANAKDRITSALTGLVLVLLSFLIIQTINPQLLRFDLSVPKVEWNLSNVNEGGVPQCPPDKTTGIAFADPISCNKICLNSSVKTNCFLLESIKSKKYYCCPSTNSEEKTKECLKKCTFADECRKVEKADHCLSKYCTYNDGVGGLYNAWQGILDTTGWKNDECNVVCLRKVGIGPLTISDCQACSEVKVGNFIPCKEKRDSHNAFCRKEGCGSAFETISAEKKYEICCGVPST